MSSLDFSDAVRNARANAVETAVGASPICRLRTGAKPTNCAAPSTGTVVATIALPIDWMGAAAAGVKALLGLWQDLAADASGQIGHFEIVDATDTTCHIRGTVTATGGGGVMTVDNPDVVAGQQITVTAFTLTEGNA
jgi:hypothetical protein